MNKKDDTKRSLTDVIRSVLFVLVIIGFIAVCIIGIIESTHNNSKNGVIWDGNVNYSANNQTKYLAISGISELYFTENEIKQHVNIYNPEENDCILSYSFIVNEDEIWRSGDLEPGYGFYDIEINKELETGIYDCLVVVNCFSFDGNELNGCTFNCKIIVA